MEDFNRIDVAASAWQFVDRLSTNTKPVDR